MVISTCSVQHHDFWNVRTGGHDQSPTVGNYLVTLRLSLEVVNGFSQVAPGSRYGGASSSLQPHGRHSALARWQSLHLSPCNPGLQLPRSHYLPVPSSIYFPHTAPDYPTSDDMLYWGGSARAGLAGGLLVSSDRGPGAAVGVLVGRSLVVHVHTRRLVSIHPRFRSSTSAWRELSRRARVVGPGPMFRARPFRVQTKYSPN